MGASAPLSRPGAAPITWEEVGQGLAGPWPAVFFQIVQELAGLLGRLTPDLETPALLYRRYLPPQVPEGKRLRRVLAQARRQLLEFHRLLSIL
jgi:hypothetical protein